MDKFIWVVMQVNKTIKQIADTLGVSKQSVYKRYKGRLYTKLLPYVHTVDGTLYIDEQGEILIKQDFLNDTASNGVHTDVHTEHIQDTPLYTVIQQLQKQLDKKDEQLERKDKQIDELNMRLAEAHQMATNAQQLHGADMVLELENETNKKHNNIKTHWWKKNRV